TDRALCGSAGPGLPGIDSGDRKVHVVAPAEAKLGPSEPAARPVSGDCGRGFLREPTAKASCRTTNERGRRTGRATEASRRQHRSERFSTEAVGHATEARRRPLRVGLAYPGVY